MTTGDIIGILFFVVLLAIATGFGLWLQRAENERLERKERKPSQ